MAQRDDPESSVPGLSRLLRRRARKDRHGRARGGKTFQSWGEYAPKSLHTTGDHSNANRWAYVAVFVLAILIVPLLIGLLALGLPDLAALPVEWKLAWLLRQMMPFLAMVAVLLIALTIDAGLRWLRRR